MNGILGMVNMLTETELTDDQKAWLSVIQQSSNSLLRILNDILDLSKVEAGRIELENSRFCISQQIEELQRFHSANATRKGLTLTVAGCEHMQLQRTGDPVRLLQILNNLFDNAIKFTPHGSVTGSFTCDACFKPSLHESEQDPNRVHFVISDTGIGMTEDQVSKVFAPFSQADPTTTRRYGGTGLGLTIAKTLTELMLGSLQVESVITEGTTFKVTLNLDPVAQVTASPEDTETTSGLPGGTENPVRILAVEDGEVNQLVLKHILNKMNTEVSMVQNGKEAVEAFKNKKFDLVLMDIHMPIMDGFAATTEIRSIEEKRGSRKTPIAAVTASVTDAEVDHYKTFGFSHCIAKPTELSRIREVIDSIRN
jgi:CheY-like chemotaxis protein